MKSGMTKVSVMYPNGEGKTFDMDYYNNTHMKMVKELLGDALKGSSSELGIGGAAPGSPAPYLAIGVMYFDSPEAFGAAFGPVADKIMSDIPNYTNTEPSVQISIIS